MYDASAQRFHLTQRPGEITYREVRQGGGVPRTTSARVEANGRNGGSRLPALTLSFGAALQGSAEQSAPKAQCTLGFVGRKLNQGQRQPLHAHNITPGGRGAPREGGIAAGGSALREVIAPRLPLAQEALGVGGLGAHVHASVGCRSKRRVCQRA